MANAGSKSIFYVLRRDDVLLYPDVLQQFSPTCDVIKTLLAIDQCLPLL